MTNTTNEDNSPDAIEQLYIESPVIGLVEFRKRIHALTIQGRIDGGKEALNGVSCHAAMGGRKTVDISWLMSKDAQEWVQYWLEDEELTALKDERELKR